MAKSFDKRNTTLLNEYKNQFKANKFNDKRIGEHDKSLTLEDKIFKRFTIERQKAKDRTNKYNLNDNEDNDELELTHLGQSLSQIEKFERIRVSDDSDEDDQLNGDNGKINAKIVSENFFGGFSKSSDENDKEAQKRNKKEWIEEMITKSKQLKYERQNERDKTLDLTEKLDAQWKEMRFLLAGSKAIRAPEARTSNRLRGEEGAEVEDIGKEEASKNVNDYDCLVKSLQFEMKAYATDKMKTQEELEREKERAFKKAELALLKRMGNNENYLEQLKKNHRSVDDMDFDDFDFSKNNKKHNEKVEILTDKVEIEGLNELDNDDDDADEDDISDEERLTKNNFKWLDSFKSKVESLNNQNLSTTEFDKYMQTLIKSLNPGLNERNKEHLVSLVEQLIDLYQEQSLKESLDKSLINLISKTIYQITQTHLKEKSEAIFVNVLKTLHVEFNSKTYPKLNTILLFKLISLVYPTSDFKHKIITPSFIQMTRYLTQCQISNHIDLYLGLYLTNICHEYISRSKRYIPECIQFLTSVLYLTIPKNQIISALNSFNKSILLESFKRTKIDLISGKRVDTIRKLSLSISNRNQKINDEFNEIYAELASYKEIFGTCIKILDLITMDNYPNELKEKMNGLKEIILDTYRSPKEQLKLIVKRPKQIAQYEPKVEARSRVDAKHHNTVISEKQLNQKRYKRELKGAIKELRKDNQFLAKVQYDETMEKDEKRKRKVKEIMGSLANQEGDYQRLKRMKK